MKQAYLFVHFKEKTIPDGGGPECRNILLRADEQFFFPYGFKHGTILTITPKQYDALSDWGQ